MSLEAIIAQGAERIGCPREAVWALAEVESRLGRIPLQRFEPHHFPAKRIDIGRTFRSNAAALEQAVAIDPEAAYRATSMGPFHIMGKWHQRLGFPSARAMYAALTDLGSVEANAQAVARYCEEIDPRVGSGLRSLDPVKVGYYNGGSRSPVPYRVKWRNALAKAGMRASVVLRAGSTGEAVERLQAALGVPVDGWFGAETEAALRHFQAAHGLKVDGIAGAVTWAALDVQHAPETTVPAPGVPEKAAAWASERPGQALGLFGGVAALAGNMGLSGVSGALKAVERGDWGGAWYHAREVFAAYGPRVLGVALLIAAAWLLWKTWKGYRDERHAKRSAARMRRHSGAIGGGSGAPIADWRDGGSNRGQGWAYRSVGSPRLHPVDHAADPFARLRKG